jgi:hypothetical protein
MTVRAISTFSMCWSCDHFAHLRQQCHNYNTVTTTALSQLKHCHNYNTVTTTTLSQLQQCQNYNTVTTTTLSQLQHFHNYNTVTTTTLSQLKICDFSGDTFKGFEVLQFSISAKTTQLLSSGEFCKLRLTLYLLKVHLQTFLSLPITQKCQILSCDTLVANERFVVIKLPEVGTLVPKHVGGGT